MSEEQTKKKPTSRPSVRPARRAKKKAKRQASAGESIRTRLKKRSEQRAEKRAEKQAAKLSARQGAKLSAKQGAKQGAEKGVAKTADKGSKAAAGKGAAVLGFFKPSQGDAPKGAAGIARFFRVPVIVCAAVLVALALLYGPARDLYCAWRENGALQEQDVKTLSEKEQIQEDISDLTSKDGIKDQARELGYVEDGETRIIVEGGDEPEEPDVVTSHDNDEGDDNGYLGFFDFFFGYEGEQ